MLALIFLIVMVILGDSICRRFYPFVSLPHRFAAAFLSGFLISSWFTYLASLLFMDTRQPLIWGNLLFFAAAIGAIFLLNKRPLKETAADSFLLSPISEANKWDWIIIGIFFVGACVLAFGTFNMSAGKVQIANHQWSDFGSTISIMQSFALGHNFPTELPHYSGERIHYHFLFYFLAGNLEFLGFNPALSINVLFILSLVSMLILVMTLGVVLFRSPAVGRIGAALFFFHGSLAYIPFVRAQTSIGELINSLLTMHDFLPSGYPYRGEVWGVWSQVVFLNQRHLASSIGFLLLVLVFIVGRCRAAFSVETDAAARNRISDESAENLPAETPRFDDSAATLDEAEIAAASFGRLKSGFDSFAPFIFSGALLGLVPLWNSAIFTAAIAVLAVLFLAFPLKKQMLALALASALIALPQVIYLKSGNLEAAGYSIFHWGYTIDDPTILKVIEYLGFTFGFKWLLIAVWLFFGTKLQRRVFVAVSSLIALAFFFQFSQEVLANHKFLTLWLVIANLFVAGGLVRLWKMRLLKTAFFGKIAAAVLTILIVVGGIIDSFPIRNAHWVEIPFVNDALVQWLTEDTDPRAIFLSHRYVNDGILLAGRRLFYGHAYYAQSAGYPTGERDVVYKRMFEEQNPQKLLRLLRQNNISYAAIDNGLRKDDFIKNLNEKVFENNFERVFEDTENRYDGLVIYKIPAGSPNDSGLSALPSEDGESAKIASVFAGGAGRGYGQFDKPRGVAADSAGNLYVADSGNSRVQKFSPDGKFLAAIGQAGAVEGQLREPNGITIDSAGNIYVADASNHRLIKFGTDGIYKKQWNGPAPGFYGLRDVAIGSNKRIYVLDQGRNRVVRLDADGENYFEWGKQGTNEGEFSDPTGLDAAGDRVFVADAGNSRIQVFDLDGKFIRQWTIPDWKNGDLGHFPDVAFDAAANRLYATSGANDEILVFDADGNHLESLKPDAPANLDNPSSLVLAEVNGEKTLYVLNTDGRRVTPIKLKNGSEIKQKPDDHPARKK